jgi:predicted phage terminase large subunit-like protein
VIPNRKRDLLQVRKYMLDAREELLVFARYMRPDNKRIATDPFATLYETAKHHAFMADKLEQLERGDIKRLILLVPPRHGKTELATKTFIPWVIGRNPTWSVINATYNTMFSGDLGRAIREIILDPRYLDIFPDMGLKMRSASAHRLETITDQLVMFVGRGGTITGRGGNLLVVDDPIKDRKEADSKQIRDQLWKWWTQVLSTRLMNDDGRILLIQTRWHEDDLAGRLTDPANPHYNAQEGKNWEVVNLPALATGDPANPDPLGRNEGEPLWPSRFSVGYLARLKNQDNRGFHALYQGEPSGGAGLFFEPADIVEYQSMKEVPANAVYYAASDHAVSTQQWADNSVFILFCVDEEDNIWIMPDTSINRLPADQAVELMIQLMGKYHPMFWWAETGHISKSIGPFLRKRMKELNYYSTSLIEVTPQFDKMARAQSIKGRMAMGKVRFPAWASWYSDARHQLLSFPAGGKDDFVDAMSMIGLGLNLQFRRRLATPKRVILPGTFGWLKEQSRKIDREHRIQKDREGW